jgi:ribosomal protein S14
MLTGRAKGVWSMWNISRHMVNKYAKFGHLPNIKVNNEK